MGVGFKNETILHSLKEVKCLQGCSRTLLLAIYFSKVDKHCTCHRHGGCHCALGLRRSEFKYCECVNVTFQFCYCSIPIGLHKEYQCRFTA